MLGGIHRQRLALIGMPPFYANYVPVLVDSAGRALRVPDNANVQLGSGATVIAMLGGLDQKLDVGSAAVQCRDGWFGGSLFSVGHRIGYNLAVYAAGTAYALTTSPNRYSSGPWYQLTSPLRH